MQLSLQKPVIGRAGFAQVQQPLKQRLPCRSSPAGRSRLHVRAIAEAEKTSTKSSGSMSSPIQQEVKHKLRYLLGKTKNYDEHDIYRGTAWSVREHLIDSFENTHDYWE
jgi:starch phosphorylase